MKLVDKTITTAVIEVTANELKQKGFDVVWDDIRVIYPATEYALDNIKENHDGKIFLLTLRSLKFYKMLDD